MTRARALGLATTLLLLTPACHPPTPTIPPLPTTAPPFLARQKVVAIHPTGRSTFDAVLQYSGDRLVLLGLTPMGTKAFAVVQEGATVEVTPYIDRPLPAPAEAVLGDIHAAYFDLPRAARADGWHRRRTAAGARMHERWAAGRLHERVWGRRRDRRATRLRFPGGASPGEIPLRIEIDRPELDLRLEIHTLELQAGAKSATARH